MSKKIYIVGKKVDGEINIVPIRAFHTFESAKKFLMEHIPDDRKLEETDLKNEFRVLDADGNYLQTTVIRDVWMVEK